MNEIDRVEPALLHEDASIKPWQPTTDKTQLAALGKFIEECAEASAIAARCVIQGVDECEPQTYVNNGERLTREVADVMAAATVLVNALGLNVPFIAQRQARKTAHFRKWHELLKKPDGEAT